MHHGTLQHEGAWSFGDSKKSEWYLLPGKNVPGPGQYEASQQTQQPTWTYIDIQEGQAQSESRIGVGSYDPKLDAVLPSPKKPTIGNEGKKRRNLRMKTGVDYNPNYSFTKEQSPSFSMGYHTETDYNNHIPGPADYNKGQLRTQQSYNRSENHFTVARRGVSMHNKPIAAVGMYNIASQDLPNYQRIKFGNSVRPNPGLITSSSGNFYNIDFRQRENAGYTLARRLPISFNKDVFPAPNHYNVQVQHKYDRRTEKSMYTGGRTRVVSKESESRPSPGTYNIEATLELGRKAVGFASSKRPKQTPLLDVPGPTHYDIRPSFNSTLGKMSWRLNPKFKNDVPAPGTYNISPPQRDRSKSWKGMHLSLRPDVSRSTTQDVGPGDYEVSATRSNELGTMGRSERECITTAKNPGPGQYDIPSTIGRIPKYYKKLARKLDSEGCTKTIKYDPKATAMVKLAYVLAKPQEQKSDKK